MDLNNVYICDIETVGFLEDIKSFDDLHVLSCGFLKNDKWEIKSTRDYDDIDKLLSNPNNTLVFHNGYSYDKPVLEKMGFTVNAEIIDTLALSYYLYPERATHGLADWGEFFGVKKPEIETWVGLSYEEYKHRCEEDVKINTNLWLFMLKYIFEIYGGDEEGVVRTIKYFNFKMSVLAMQEANPLYIDQEKLHNNTSILEDIILEKEKDLNSILPKIPTKVKRTKPKNMYKKDGDLSKAGESWISKIEACGLPYDYDGVIEEVVSYNPPNCQSPKQMKEFLFSLGWKPKIYKDGANGKVPQLRDDNKELCPDIKRLVKDFPELNSLDGLSVAQHRLGYLKSFKSKGDDMGRVQARAHGFTKTLRLKHVAPIVNLPKPNADLGEYVRGCIVAPKGMKIVGADLSSIEDKTKQIMIYPLDPDYVATMNTKGYDAHLTLGKFAKVFNDDEIEFYQWFKNLGKKDNPFHCPEVYISLSSEEQFELFEELDLKRSVTKTSNYALTYGCGVPKLMESAGISKKEATSLHKGYWDLNWSVKEYPKSRVVKEVKGTTWLRGGNKVGDLQQVETSNWIYNEFTGLWLFLKNDKDRFSAINQNNGVKVFDMWCYFIIREGVKISLQSHDEIAAYCKEEDVEKVCGIIMKAIDKVNQYFKPPILFECDYKVGDNYAEVH